jgi:single-stranded-DNA-specific exonuclease
MKKHWRILQPDLKSVQRLSSELNCTPITACILVNRNIVSVEKASRFLNPSMQHLRPPFGLKDMDIAAERIGKAIRSNEKILIFGDYDVDGVTATAVLFEFLQQAGANISYYIPHRLKEGYGLQEHHITDYAAPHEFDLIITADCGTASHAAVRRARSAGIDIIITDHHSTSDKLPEAVAVINPQRPDCDAGFEHLAGVGVALALVIGLRKHLRESAFWTDRPEPNLKALCDLVALGTVADAVALIDENRIFTRIGLDVIRSGPNRPGLVELLKRCKIDPRQINAEDLAFQIIPRLNAAGRMDHARLAAALFTVTDSEQAGRIADNLNGLNIRRKKTEKDILREIRTYLSNNPQELNNSSLVLAHPDWHLGVLGIVASRLAEQYYRPVVLISIKDGTGKGSARSVPGIDLYRGLTTCSEHLETLGGHAMAAGLQVKEENLLRFKQQFEETVRTQTGEKDVVPEIVIDRSLHFDEITNALIDEIETLRPFGAGNPDPLFLARNIQVSKSQIVGQNHRRMLLQQPEAASDRAVSAIHFNVDTGRPLPETFDKIAFRLQWNRWNGRKVAQMVIEATVPD